jgi:hypothetical protein
MFRLTITLGIVPDVTFDVPSKEYLPPAWYSRAYNSISASTDWSPSLEGMPGTTLELAMKVLPPDDSWTLMLSVGIEYGAFRQNGKIEEVRRFGAAKILALQGKDVTSDNGGEDDSSERDEAPYADVVTLPDDVHADEPGQSPIAVAGPKIQYVYTVKASRTETPEARVYGYIIPVAVPAEIPDVDTTQHGESFQENVHRPSGMPGRVVDRLPKLYQTSVGNHIFFSPQHNSAQPPAPAPRRVKLSIDKSARAEIDDHIVKGKSLTFVNGNGPRES